VLGVAAEQEPAEIGERGAAAEEVRQFDGELPAVHAAILGVVEGRQQDRERGAEWLGKEQADVAWGVHGMYLFLSQKRPGEGPAVLQFEGEPQASSPPSRRDCGGGERSSP
jgi:hypothetical protein